jgi:uncharacterized protein YjiS (DUF1127 family)
MTTIELSPEISGETRREAARPRRIGSILAAVAAWFNRWRERRAERQMLLDLADWDPRLLRDIGISAYDVKAALRDRHRGLANIRQY